MFAIGLQTLQHSSEIQLSNVSCKDEKALHSGSSLINFINTVRIVAFCRLCTRPSAIIMRLMWHNCRWRSSLWCSGATGFLIIHVFLALHNIIQISSHYGKVIRSNGLNGASGVPDKLCDQFQAISHDIKRLSGQKFMQPEKPAPKCKSDWNFPHKNFSVSLPTWQKFCIQFSIRKQVSANRLHFIKSMSRCENPNKKSNQLGVELEVIFVWFPSSLLENWRNCNAE